MERGLICAWLLLVAGCDGDKGSDTSSASGGDNDGTATESGDGNLDGSIDSEGLEDTLGLDPGCEEFQGYAIPGASRYFIGEFVIDGDGNVTGEEMWALYANSTWVANGNDDCQAVWSISGVQDDPQGCGSCDYSLVLQAELDGVATDCPEDTYAGFESQSFTYNVQISGNESTVYFTSGNVLGVGAAAGQRVSYVSDGSCVWF